MATIFRDFRRAYAIQSGPLLSTTITPIAPHNDIKRLQVFYHNFGLAKIPSEFRSDLLSKSGVHLSHKESAAWIELFTSYWKAIGRILEAEKATLHPDWAGVYEAWKDVANVLVRGYNQAGFPVWTLPCLYVVSRYLRGFAIKADKSASGSEKSLKLSSGGFGDDVVGDLGKNEKLEDAARLINRIFTLCVSDRYVDCTRTSFQPVYSSYLTQAEAYSGRAPIEESRKWGIYYTTNLLFKTYFKVCMFPNRSSFNPLS